MKKLNFQNYLHFFICMIFLCFFFMFCLFIVSLLGRFNRRIFILLFAVNDDNLCCGNCKFMFIYFLKDAKDRKDSKEHPKGANGSQNVKLTYSNGSITNVSINISEEVNKTTIWKQLTENNKTDLANNTLKSQP